MRDWSDRVSVAAMGILFYCLFAMAIVVMVGLRLYSRRLRLRADNPAENLKTIPAIKGISVSIEIDEKRSLFVLVGEDGSISRMGSGTLDETESRLFVGKTDPAVFKAVRSRVTETMLQMTGRIFEAKNPQGVACKLKIAWQFTNETSGGFVYCYGSESQGPPGFVADFVRASVGETDAWYEDFKRAAASGRKP